jgi:hypothetical protein
LLKEGVNLTLVGIVGVSEVEDLTRLAVGEEEVKSLGNIVSMNGVETKARSVQRLLLLAGFLVDGTNNEAGSETVDVTGTIHNGGANNNVVKISSASNMTLSGKVGLSNGSPRLQLGVLGRGLLASGVHLGSRNVNETGNVVLGGFFGGVLGSVDNVGVIHLLALGVLGRGSKVDHILPVTTIVLEESSDRGRVTDVSLLEGHEVLVLLDGKLLLGETSDLVENLVSDKDFRGELVLKQVHHQMSANEATASKDHNTCVTHGVFVVF